MRTPCLNQVLFGLLLLCLAGCGGEASDPNLRPASGTLTQSGSPLADATVTLSPADSKSGQTASGNTDASGRFQLGTFKVGDGALIGKYKVSVSKFNPKYVMPEPGKEPSEPYNLVPEQFTNPETSGLTAEVSADGENVFQFDLK